MNSSLRKYLTILALSFAGGSIYTLPYLKYIFYDTQLEVMGINNTQSGFLLSMYAIGCIASYIPGGLITDRISPRKAIAFSLFATAALGLFYGFTFSYTLSLGIWLLFAATTAFVFWSSLLKAVGMSGSSEEQGFLYGLYYAGNGVTGAVMNSLALAAFSYGSNPRESLFYAVATLSAGIALAGIAVWFLVREGKVDTNEEDKFKFDQVKGLLTNPVLWIFSLIVFCGYAIFSNATYFTPYLTNVVGISVEESGVFSIIRNYLFYLLAPLAGLLADRVFRSTTKLFVVLFALISLSLFGVMYLPEGMSQTGISIYTLLPGAFGLMLYGLVFSVIREVGIPPMMAGTAIAIASMIGYTPDFFMSAMFGSWLDAYGNAGYDYIFTFLGVTCIVGMIISFIVYMKSRGQRIAA